MPRLLSTLLVVALLGGTAAAFAVTQGLKIEPSPILAPRIAKVFSPVCDCSTRVATIQFKLRKPDRVRLEIVGDDHVVRTLVSGKRLRSGKVAYTWNGRDDQGRFVPQGVYSPRVHLEGQRRTIDLPNEMRIDTTPPQVRSLAAVAAWKRPLSISPDGDRQGDRVMLGYRFSERAHAILFVDGRREVFTRGQQPSDVLFWNGKVDGKVVKPGTHVLRVAGQDIAGNIGRAAQVRIRVRYVALARDRIVAKAGTRFGVRVSADGAVHWRIGARSGTAKPGLLVLRAPGAPGRYTLTVSVGEHRARAALIVRPRA